jgi:RimJ/RimL family protein N-acetyltransferase
MDAVAIDQPELRTPRLRLREIRADDADALWEIHSDPGVMRYWSTPAWTRREQATERVAFVRGQRERAEVYAWAVADAASDRMIGSIALFELDLAHARASVGYSLHPAWHGRGLAQEAVRAVLAWAIDVRGLQRIEADADPRNAPSCRLLERLGFVREGVLRERWHVADEVCDTALHGLLAREFVREASAGHGASREALGANLQGAKEGFAACAAPTNATEPQA